MTSLRDQRGSTLMELMVYLAISGIVILSMTTFVGALTKTRVETTNQQLVQDAARVTIERMTFAIRNSRTVVISSGRLDSTDEAGVVTTFCLCDGTVKTGQATGAPPSQSDLLPLIDESITVDTISFEKIASSVRVTLQYKKALQETKMVSTIAFRQAL